MFTDAQIKMLQAPLTSNHVKTREQSGRKLSYVEGWHVIAEANRIFGFNAWHSETVDIRCVSEKPRKIGRPPNQKDGWGVSYVAKVRINVAGVIREGVGAGHGIDVDPGLAHESAIKEAETDARKRALMTFGNPFGLALYDKEQANVCDAPDESLTLCRDRAFAAFAAARDVGEIDARWKELVPQMNALGIVKGDPSYQEIVAEFARLKKALAAAERKAA